MSAEREVYLFISRFPPPFGGVSNQVKNLAEYACARSEKPLDIFVIDLKTLEIHRCSEEVWETDCLFKNWRFYLSAIRSIPTLLLNLMKHNYFSFKPDRYVFWRFLLLFFSGALYHYLRNSKVYFLYSFHFGAPSYVGGLLARFFEASHVTAVFGEAFSNYEKLSSQKNVLLELSGKMVSCSDHCGRMMRVIDPNIEYSVLYYGSDLQYLSELASCRSTRPTKNPPTVMFLGRLNPEMGIDYFISLIISLDEITPAGFRYIICGQEDVGLPSVRRFAADFTGDLTIEVSATFERRNELLLEADIVVVPSVNDRACFGLAITEGIAAGCIVYARDVGGHIEPLLGHNRFIFERDLSPSELAERLVGDLDDAELRVLAEELRSEVIQRFDITTCLESQIKMISANSRGSITFSKNRL